MIETLEALMPEIVIASKNAGKINEFKDFFASLPLNILSQPDSLEINETGRTFIENARIKAIAASTFTGKIALSDDSGLCIDSLGGAPGVYSARYADDDDKRIKRVLKELANFQNRNAFFSAAICVASSRGKVLLEVEGKCEGLITLAPRGNYGFGYDPIFEVKGKGLTFAEMNSEQKKLFSHRGKAFEALKPELKKLFGF